MSMAAGVLSSFWPAVTRVGESEILVPAFIAGALWLWFARPAGARARAAVGGAGALGHPARSTAARWFAALFATTAVTTLSKVAFLGFGFGSAALDFTGFSGHSMFSMAILPVLAAIVGGRAGAVGGATLALTIMVSRVMVGAHSISEALTGAALGGAVALWTLQEYLGHPGAVRAPWWTPLAMVLWLTLLPWRAPPSRSHDVVVALSLKLSGHQRPYTRFELLAGLIRRPPIRL